MEACLFLSDNKGRLRKLEINGCAGMVVSWLAQLTVTLEDPDAHCLFFLFLARTLYTISLVTRYSMARKILPAAGF